MLVRKAAVAGQFYPAQKEEVIRYIEHFNRMVDTYADWKKLSEKKVRAVIVPHAGYIYSGFTANATLRILAAQRPKRLVVIGPSHRVYLEGFSVGLFDAYETPLGMLHADTVYARHLLERYGGTFLPEAHAEHSTEVQFPLIAYYMPQTRIIEIVYGNTSPDTLVPLILDALFDADTAVVISTDLSHYYDIDKAKRLDGICLEAVATLDRALLHRGCEACGKIGVEAMIEAARRRGLKPEVVDYRTSADASGERSQVVGYMGAIFEETK